MTKSDPGFDMSVARKKESNAHSWDVGSLRDLNARV